MLNKLIVMGRLTRDPELRSTQTGKAVANFAVACDRDIGEGADFIEIVAWGKMAELAASYFKKGMLVAATGRLQSRKWQDKDGKSRISWELVAESLHFAEAKKKAETFTESDEDDGKLPF